jgi:hypothetical protein
LKAAMEKNATKKGTRIYDKNEAITKKKLWQFKLNSYLKKYAFKINCNPA